MAKYSGQGGTVKVKTGPQVEIGVGKWKLSKKKVGANVTNSKSAGIKQRKGTIRDQMVTLDMPWDSTEDPTTLGIDEGSEVQVELTLGSSGQKWTSTAVYIESVDYETDFDEGVIGVSIIGYANVAFALTTS